MSNPDTRLKLVIGNRNYSSWSMRPWLLMRQLGVDFEEVRVPLDTPEFRERIGSLSPTRRVPALISDSLTIWDSLAIIEYVGDRFGLPIWPDDSGARAIARSVSAEMHSGFEALRTHLPLNVRGRGRPRVMDDAVRADIERIGIMWRECLDRSGGPLLFGAFTAADAMYAPVVSRFVTDSVDGVADDYAAAVMALPAYQAWAGLAAGETEQIADAESRLLVDG